MPSPAALRGLSAERIWDFENGFYWFCDNRRIGKAIAQYELYKRILSLPGHIVECGVYKGASLIRFATFRQLLEAPDSRDIFGFDAFGEFPRESLARDDDQDFIGQFETAGGDGLTSGELQGLLEAKGLTAGVHLIKGDARETIAPFLAERPELRIALLHLDMDVYEPTRAALEQFWDRVMPGGLIVIDDYNAVAGATAAVDEFVASRPSLSVEKLSSTHVPAFIVKR